MDLAEKLSGHRKTYGLNVIGGVRRDILAEQKLSTLTTIHQLRSEVQELVDMLLSTPNFIERTSGIGILDRKIARDFSPVGPLMRGSGYARDVRFDHPFDGYADPDVQKMHAATADTCDAFGRTAVRIQEVYDSIDMIETMLENCPSGPILTTDWEYTPHKYAIGATELRAARTCTGPCSAITRSATAGAPRRPRTATGRSCATCSAATPWATQR